MSREAVERMRARLYKDRLKKTGRLPSGKETLSMEKRIAEVAKKNDMRRERKL